MSANQRKGEEEKEEKGFKKQKKIQLWEEENEKKRERQREVICKSLPSTQVSNPAAKLYHCRQINEKEGKGREWNKKEKKRQGWEGGKRKERQSEGNSAASYYHDYHQRHSSNPTEKANLSRVVLTVGTGIDLKVLLT